MDDCEHASALEQRYRDAAIADAANTSAIAELPAVGCCYNCESILSDGLRFCDSDCRNDYMGRRSAEVRRTGHRHV